MHYRSLYVAKKIATQFYRTRQIGLFLVMVFWQITGHTCAISPFYQIVSEPEKYVEKSNTVFYGRVLNLNDDSDTIQIAEFEVIDMFKGDVHSNIRIVNEIKSNCSSKFNAVGDYYYVFGNLTNPGNEIIMHGFPAFVPQQYADKMNLPDKLRALH